jgi:hypothetical protein
MKKQLFFCIVLCYSFIIQAQKLNGIITLQNSGGKAIEGAIIASNGGDYPTSNEKGLFSLTYPTNSPGDWVNFNVVKEGFEVANILDLLLVENETNKGKL